MKSAIYSVGNFGYSQNFNRRTRLGYISLLEDEEKYVRETMLKMTQSGFNVGKNVGGKLARLAILLLCDLYNSGKIAKSVSIKDEDGLRLFFLNSLSSSQERK